MRASAWWRAATLLGLGAALALAVAAATALGTVRIPLGEVAGALVRGLLGRVPVEDAAVGTQTIILQLRLPRVLTAAVVGAALAAAGTVFQGLLRNPMADPYIIGTSGGAALGATLALILPFQVVWLGFGAVPILAFVGAVAAVLVVYRVARVGVRTPVTTLLLAGFAMSSMMAAVMSFLMLAGARTLQRVVLWTMGGVTASGWGQIAVVAALVALGMGLAYLLSNDLNALMLGEEQAGHLGIDVERRKLALLLVGSLLTAAAVTVSGLVGFVGLVVPHVSRLLFGPDHRFLLPTSALLGAILLILSDLLARTLMAPAEIPVGIITALMGAPFFIYLLRRSKREYVF